jgi:hypothetical protein
MKEAVTLKRVLVPLGLSGSELFFGQRSFLKQNLVNLFLFLSRSLIRMVSLKFTLKFYVKLIK